AFERKATRDVAAAVKRANAPLAVRDAELIARKYEAISNNPFSFFRGTAYLYYADVAEVAGLRTAVTIPLMGDLHLENLGTYRTATGVIAYDLNDFDEAAPGPYTWELARLAVSIHLAAEANGMAPQADALVKAFLKAYAGHLGRLDAKSLQQPLTTGGPAVKAAIAKAGAASRVKFLAKLGADGRFVPGKKLRAVTPETASAVRDAVATYSRGRAEGAAFFRVKDVGQSLAGTASLGRYRYSAWIEGPTNEPTDDVILDIKEQLVPILSPKATAPQADRACAAQRHFLPGTEPLMGTVMLRGASMLVREYSPDKESVELSSLKTPADVEDYLDTVALAAARAHARSGKQQAILGEWAAKAPAIAQFAAGYASQVKADCQAFAASLKK
ncbi:MAG: DUF2252 family protein, partial [Candidatus Sericytochromatia bacterium]